MTNHVYRVNGGELQVVGELKDDFSVTFMKLVFGEHYVLS